MLKVQKVTTVAQVKEMLDPGFTPQDIVTYHEHFKGVKDEMFQYRLSQAVKATKIFVEAIYEVRKFQEYRDAHGLGRAVKEYGKFLDCGGFSLSWLKDQYLAAMEELEEYILSA